MNIIFVSFNAAFSCTNKLQIISYKNQMMKGTLSEINKFFCLHLLLKLQVICQENTCKVALNIQDKHIMLINI